MHRVIYPDTYFMLNLVMDATSLLITSRILSRRVKWWRILLGALLGAAASLLPLFYSRWWASALAFLTFVPMNLISFGWERARTFFLTALFQILSALVLGGAVEALYWYSSRLEGAQRLTPGIFLFCLCLGLGVFSLWGKSTRRRLEESVVSITIRRGDAQADLYALVDSGSLLREPVSGFPVILVKASAATPLFSREELAAFRQGDGGAGVPLYAVPLRTASGSGVLFGFRPTMVGLHHKAFRKAYRETNRAVVALDFSDGAFAGCSCLVPLSMI